MSIRVVIADDQALVRGGFHSILAGQADIEVIGEAEDGNRAVDRLHPDVVLMDIRMPGIDATRQITAEAGEEGPRVLILTTFDLDEYVYEALRAGASGFLLKDAGAQELLQAVRVVASGDALLAPAITRRLIEDFASRPRATARPAAVAELTPRELEVLHLIARGLSNTEIARELVVSDATVKSHVNRILTKLNLRDRAQAIVLAYEIGLVEPGSGSSAPSPS